MAILAAKLLRRSLKARSSGVPKGFLAVYVGEGCKRRYVVPISYLNYPSFQDLLRQDEEEFGFAHPMDGLTIPCRKEIFFELTSRLCSV